MFRLLYARLCLIMTMDSNIKTSLSKFCILAQHQHSIAQSYIKDNKSRSSSPKYARLRAITIIRYQAPENHNRSSIIRAAYAEYSAHNLQSDIRYVSQIDASGHVSTGTQLRLRETFFEQLRRRIESPWPVETEQMFRGDSHSWLICVCCGGLTYLRW